MATRDLIHNITVKQVVVPGLKTANATPNTTGFGYVDTQDFESATLVLSVGAVDAAGTFALTLQECDTANGTYTDVATSDLIGSGGSAGSQPTVVSTANSSANTIQVVGYRGNKRYLGVKLVTGGTVSTGAAINGEVILANGRHLGGAMTTLAQ